jgi:hypothetical protein
LPASEEAERKSRIFASFMEYDHGFIPRLIKVLNHSTLNGHN